MEYLVKIYEDSDKGPRLVIVSDSVGRGETLWEYLELAKGSGLKISVYPLGACALDWS